MQVVETHLMSIPSENEKFILGNTHRVSVPGTRLLALQLLFSCGNRLQESFQL